VRVMPKQFETKHPCSRCGTPCFRIAYIGSRLVCVECFGLHVAALAAPLSDGEDT
jgi:hypothetical protein